MGGEDEIEEIRIESTDAWYAGAELQFRVAGDHTRAGAADARAGRAQELGRHPGRVRVAVGAGGGHGGGATRGAGAAARGHTDHHVVDDAVPDAPVHGHGPLPGVQHLTQARALPREHTETHRRPFPSYVSSVLPFDF